jgi:hypothetical protein
LHQREAGILAVAAAARLPLLHEQGPSPTDPGSARGPIPTRLPPDAPRGHGAGCRPRTCAGTRACPRGPAQDRAVLVSVHDDGQGPLAEPGDPRDRLYRIPGPLGRVLCVVLSFFFAPLLGVRKRACAEVFFFCVFRFVSVS